MDLWSEGKGKGNKGYKGHKVIQNAPVGLWSNNRETSACMGWKFVFLVNAPLPEFPPLLLYVALLSLFYNPPGKQNFNLLTPLSESLTSSQIR